MEGFFFILLSLCWIKVEQKCKVGLAVGGGRRGREAEGGRRGRELR